MNYLELFANGIPLAKDLIPNIPSFYNTLPITNLNWASEKMRELNLIYNGDIDIVNEEDWWSIEDVNILGDITKGFRDGLREISKYYNKIDRRDDYNVFPPELQLLYLIGVKYNEDDDYDATLNYICSNNIPVSMDEWGKLVISTLSNDGDAIDSNVCLIIHSNTAIEIIMPKECEDIEKFASDICIERSAIPVFYQFYYEEDYEDDVPAGNIAAIHCIKR